MTNLILPKMGGVTALAVSLLGFSAPADAVSFTTFTNEADFRAATVSLTEEDFNSFTADASFDNGATVTVPTGFSLTGFLRNPGSGSSLNFNVVVTEERTPERNINGSPYILGITKPAFMSFSANGFSIEFASPISAFGATFSGVSDNDRMTRIRAVSDAGSFIVGDIPLITEESTGFFGFTADSSFNTLTFEARTTLGDDLFGFDNVIFQNATPVPFEFSPALGLGFLGAAFVIKKKFMKKGK